MIDVPRIVMLLCVATVLLAVLYWATKWAIRGDGLWPRGILGVALAIVLIIGLPCMVLAFFRALERKQPVYWVIPPLRDTREEAYP
jgi:hypothetical protein